MKAWIAACKSGGGPSTLVFPKGTYVSGPVTFAGPCKGTITVQVQGTIKATTDLSDYDTQDWFLFESIDGLILTGGGTFDGQGQAVWKYNDCHQNPNCQLLPTVSAQHIYTHTLIIYIWLCDFLMITLCSQLAFSK